MKKNRGATKFSVVIFSIIYILIGTSNMISGADKTSRFYYYDDKILRVLGLLFIITSIGLILKRKIALKAIVILIILSALELIITYNPAASDMTVMITLFFILILLHIIPLAFFLSFRVREYFYDEAKLSYFDEGFIDSSEYNRDVEMKHSTLGITSFIISIINIVLFILLVTITRNYVNIESPYENALLYSPIMLVIVLIFFINFILSLVGIGFGIAAVFSRNKDKVLGVWGITFNLIITMIYISAIIIVIMNLREIVPNSPPSQVI